MNGVCRVCGCTDKKPCLDEYGPCSWVTPNLCSACDRFGEAAAQAFLRGFDGDPLVEVYTEGDLNRALAEMRAAERDAL
jgi:hypothetical protein